MHVVTPIINVLQGHYKLSGPLQIIAIWMDENNGDVGASVKKPVSQSILRLALLNRLIVLDVSLYNYFLFTTV